MTKCKRQSGFVFLFFLSLGSCFAQLTPFLLQVKSDTIIRWQFYSGDEFSGQRVDENRWYNGYPWGGLSYIEDQWADPANATISNGVLQLSLEKTDELRKFPEWMVDTNAMKKHGKRLVDGKYPLKYKGSCIWSKEQFRYGYFECRCKTPSGKGLWPAFWLYGGNPNDEIDFMELKGEKEKEIHVDVHCPDNCDGGYPNRLGIKKNWGGWVKINSSLNADWNLISGVWMPGQVVFFVNGTPVANFSGDFKNPMNLIANLAIAADNGPFNPGPDKKTVFPAKMEVDYIRVWKTPEDPAFSQRRNALIEFDQTPKLSTTTETVPRLKKPIRFMFHKKKVDAENGFISFYPSGAKKYVVHFNGKVGCKASLEVFDGSDKLLQTKNLNYGFTELDFSDINQPVYMKLKLNGQSTMVQVNL
jgi:beta-glucanase (GH16 family)